MGIVNRIHAVTHISSDWWGKVKYLLKLIEIK